MTMNKAGKATESKIKKQDKESGYPMARYRGLDYSLE